jgi:ribosomal protein S13
VPRIAGIDVPDKKKIYFALQYIHGIGPKFAKDILAEAGVDPDQRANEVDEAKLAQINAIIDANYLVEGALRRQVQQNIQRLKDIKQLPRRSPPQGPAGPRPAHAVQRPHPQGQEEDGRRQEGRQGQVRTRRWAEHVAARARVRARRNTLRGRHACRMIRGGDVDGEEGQDSQERRSRHRAHQGDAEQHDRHDHRHERRDRRMGLGRHDRLQGRPQEHALRRHPRRREPRARRSARSA